MSATVEAPSGRRARPSLTKVERFKGEVHRWAEKIGVQPKRIQVQRMSTKWASCSPAGRVSFSADLLAQDQAFREFVIVHELLHLLVPNHGKLFKSLVAAYLPGWERAAQGRRSHSCGCRGTLARPRRRQ